MLANNRELYDYLILLRDKLRERGAAQLSSDIDRASKHVAGMSTEFIGESRHALRSVHQRCESVLQPGERDELEDVLHQLERAVERRK